MGSGSDFYRQMREVEPNPGHHAIARLEQLGIVKWTITQNVDGLHEKAGTQRVMHYHGTVEKLRCLSCGSRFGVDEYSLEKLPPLCRCGRPLKYDVVHFQEPIPSDIMDAAEEEAMKCDLMLICGTSAVVYPFAALPAMARSRGRGQSGVKIIEVNAEPTPLTHQGMSDYLIQGKTGEILPLVVDEVGKLLSQRGKHGLTSAPIHALDGSALLTSRAWPMPIWHSASLGYFQSRSKGSVRDHKQKDLAMLVLVA